MALREKCSRSEREGSRRFTFEHVDHDTLDVVGNERVSTDIATISNFSARTIRWGKILRSDVVRVVMELNEAARVSVVMTRACSSLLTLNATLDIKTATMMDMNEREPKA